MDLINEEGLFKLFDKLKSIALGRIAPELSYDDFSDDLRPLVDVVNNIASSLAEINSLANSLAKGKLSETNLSKSNYLSGHFKELQAKLTHLSWQARQIQDGNYDQRLEYFGDLSFAVNSMVEQLAERESALREQVDISFDKTESYKKLISVMETVLDNVSERVFVIDCYSGTTIYMNQSAKSHLGDMIAANHIMENCSLYKQVAQMKIKPRAMRSEFYCDHYKRWYIIASNPIAWSGENPSALYIEKDITDTKEVESLEQIAYLDANTGAYNRRFAYDTLNELFAQKAPVAICFIDLDNLKSINDTYGHAAGDEYIMTVYKTLTESLRRDDCVCRIGGDEFLAILKGGSCAAAKRVATKVNNILQQISQAKNLSFEYSISTGVAMSDYDLYDNAESFVKAADALMYEEKKFKKVARE